MARVVPIIDLSGYLDATDKAGVVDAVREACEKIGFLVIKGHGVPAETIAGVIAAAEAFYALPVEAKKKYVRAPNGAYRGYAELANMSLGQSLGAAAPPDLREGFTINRVQDKSDPYFHSPAAGLLFADNIWPDATDAPGFEAAFTRYYLAMDTLSLALMRIFALALGLDEGFFDDKVDRHFSNMCAFHYPPMAEPPLPGQLRGGAHTDFGGLTLVHGSPSAAGLQVHNGAEWEDVPIEPGTFVVNLGDLMAQWTNDKWVSTLHRVANPPEGAWDEARLSLVFFHQPNYDTLIESLDTDRPAKYPPVTSGDHLKRKLSAMRVAAAA